MVGEEFGADAQLLGGIIAFVIGREGREARLGTRARTAIFAGFG